MVNIYQHVQYCEGRGYVNPHSLGDAVAKERGDKRVMTDLQGMAQRLQQNNQQKTAFQQINLQQGLAQQTQAQTLGQRVAQFIARPIASASQLLRQAAQVPARVFAGIAQQMQKLPGMLTRLAGQIGAFFMNTKQSRNEKDEEVKKKREDSDVANADAFEINTIKEPNESSSS